MTEEQLEILKSVFTYDQTSKSCLKWNINYFVGNPNSILRSHIGQDAGSMHGTGYYRVKYKDIFYGPVHRLIWMLFNGLLNDSLVIDHLNGIKTDNRIENLRAVDIPTNTRNSKKSVKNTSGVAGVSLHRNSYWKAQWYDENGSLSCKYFSINKLGNDTSFRLAVQYRESKINELENFGIYYTDRHGK